MLKYADSFIIVKLHALINVCFTYYSILHLNTANFPCTEPPLVCSIAFPIYCTHKLHLQPSAVALAVGHWICFPHHM